MTGEEENERKRAGVQFNRASQAVAPLLIGLSRVAGHMKLGDREDRE